MKKIFILSVLCMIALTSVFAQATDDKQAEIKFETTTHNFGTFPEKDGKVSCVFKFKNTGNASLIIHQAIASCGCTVPKYTKEPIKPGESGTIEIHYNGKGRNPGYFKKSITVRTNAKNKVTRLYIEGTMNKD